MKKNFQDIVPPKKSIRNIEVPPRKNRVEIPVTRSKINKRRIEPDDSVLREEYEKTKPQNLGTKSGEPISDLKNNIKEIPQYKYDFDEPKKISKKILYVTIFLFVLAVAFGISALFKSAKITITPRHQTLHMNYTMTADKNDTGSLTFQIVNISKDIQKTVPSDGQVQVQKKATGSVVILNNTTQAQKLVANTRLQTPEGLIFRLNSSVTVPASTNKTGVSNPGSVEVTVTADAVGDKYNIELKDFTIPGLKSDKAKYNNIYGRSKTAMTGGFSGMQAVISPKLLASTTAEMQANLKNSLISDIASQIPSNFILYPDSMVFSFAPIIQTSTTDNNTVLDEKGTAYGVIFDRGALSREIAELSSEDELIKIDNLEDLTFAYATSSAFNPSANQTKLTFSLLGDANMIWVFDQNKLKTDLLGLSKNQAKTVISGYPAISEVWIETMPFWNQTIPKDPSKVKLLTN